MFNYRLLGAYIVSGRLQAVLAVLQAVGVVLVGWLLLIVCALVIGVLLPAINSQMAWFTNTWLLTGLFVAPELFVLIGYHCLIKAALYKVCDEISDTLNKSLTITHVLCSM